MPSKARYAREKAKAAAQGTTPYRQRVRSAQKRAPGTPRQVAAGHAPSGRGLAVRARRRQIREAFGAGPTGWCVVCGSQVELGRPNSYADRVCGNEQVRRFRADGDAWASFRGLALLSRNRAWVRARQAQSRAAGIPVQTPPGVVLDDPAPRRHLRAL
jgi:hypothetical protein